MGILSGLDGFRDRLGLLLVQPGVGEALDGLVGVEGVKVSAPMSISLWSV